MYRVRFPALPLSAAQMRASSRRVVDYEAVSSLPSSHLQKVRGDANEGSNTFVCAFAARKSTRFCIYSGPP